MNMKSLSGASVQGLVIGAFIGLIFGLLMDQPFAGIIMGASIGLGLPSALARARNWKQ